MFGSVISFRINLPFCFPLSSLPVYTRLFYFTEEKAAQTKGEKNTTGTKVSNRGGDCIFCVFTWGRRVLRCCLRRFFSCVLPRKGGENATNDSRRGRHCALKC
eukprot:Hpha_TRINITY_DN22286_c0_g1::TRINITY_DN22286_c0_g1_i1::g.167033::m.167033